MMVFLLSFLLSQNPPELWYARVIQHGEKRVLALAGRDLWQGPEHVDRNTPLPHCTLERATRPTDQTPEMYPLTLWAAEEASGQGANRCLPYLQLWVIPDHVPADTTNGYLVRYLSNPHAGRPGIPARAPVIARVAPVEVFGDDRPPYLLGAGKIHGRDTPLIVKANTTFDGRGCVLVPNAGFRGSALVILESGATFTQAWVHVPAHARIGRAISLSEGRPRNVRVHNVHVVNESFDPNRDGQDGIGIDVRSAEDSLFQNITISAARSIDCNPSDMPRRNTFVNICCSAPRQTRDGQGGRGWGGEENLLLWCQWGDMDRSPTLSPQGSPLYRLTMFECRQSGTGYTEGASEGLLIEAKKHLQGELSRTPAGYFLRTMGKGLEYVRPGYVITFHDGTRRFARLRAVETMAGTNEQGFKVELDRDLGAMTQQAVLVGNCLHEANILRPFAENGKAGIVLWCGSIDCAIVGGDFRRLRYGIYRMARMNPPGDVMFQWNLRTQKSEREPLNFFEQVTFPFPEETADRPK